MRNNNAEILKRKMKCAGEEIPTILPIDDLETN